MNDDKPQWPILPTFLSLRQGCTEEDANYNTDGIFYTDYLRGFLADLSHDKHIQNALSLFQFVPDVFLPLDPNAEDPNIISSDPQKGTVLLNCPLDPRIEPLFKNLKKNIVRIDSGTFVNNGRLCDAYRDIGEKNKESCFMRDSIVGIFADDELNDFDPYSDDDRTRLEQLIESYFNNDSGIVVDNVEVELKKRTYLHYTCPVSLFEEHVFPICVRGQIVACLMLGQMARENFNRESCFCGYRNIMKDKQGNAIDFANIKIVSCEGKEEWDKKARAIVERIITFEKRLEVRLEHRNSRYINDAFEEIEQKFREDVKNINIKQEEVSSEFTKALNNAFTAIRAKFDKSSDGFIRMFALPIDINQDELIPIGWTDTGFIDKDISKFYLKQLNGIDATLSIADKVIQQLKQQEIIKEAASPVIKERFDEGEDIFLPGWLAGNEVAYIVWKRHNYELKNKSNRNNLSIYKKALKNFYSIAQECYSYIRGARMELLLEATIQESAHESAHFILPAIDAVEKQLYLMPEQMILSAYTEEYLKYRDSYSKYKDEVLESLNQLWSINSGSSLIFASDLKIKKENVEVFYLLYKYKKMLENRAKDNHMSISYSQSDNYVNAYIDVTYFNHALYNLLDNAIKYGHEGSNIHIIMDVDKTQNTLKIRIVSYGIGIPDKDKDRIYNRFERGVAASNISKGTGIGMYIVRKVCRAHGGNICHKSIKISNYNIPVLFNFKTKSTLANKCTEEDKINFNEELIKLSGEVERKVVNDDYFVRYAYVFSSRVKTPTYKNTFYITIPMN